MNRRDALIQIIDSLHAEIAAMQANDVTALETATAMKLQGIEAVAANDDVPLDAELETLAREAQRLNETARIYVNLMSANVRRRIEQLTGGGLPAYRPGIAASAHRSAAAAYR
ncbi:flagellar protein FlgN [Sphingomonas sp. T9W2]|uniref:flagellar protein FlgN n=1 Tax=Sphingomonas sp. T9W2 TaxID=3143183 RepID=UPI0031F4ADDD